MTQKMQIAILGGGIGALTAAFELTEQDPKNERYDITVYTLGWRLGGKCLVGRDEQRDWRALEHGLHVWAGFYDNAFDLVQTALCPLGAFAKRMARQIRRPEPFHRHGVRQRLMEALAASGASELSLIRELTRIAVWLH